MERMDVVGMVEGFAGLRAMQKLRDQCKRVAVLEASDRIGGFNLRKVPHAAQDAAPATCGV